MQIRALGSLTLLLCACARPDQEEATILVSNMTVGLMREESDGSWHIYSRGNKFPLRPNGSCDVAGKTQDCMWYGVEFDYSPATATVTLVCTAAFNKKSEVFDEQHKDDQKTDTTSFDVPLDGARGHMAIESAVFRQPGDTSQPWIVTVVCEHRGKELLKYSFTALHES